MAGRPPATHCKRGHEFTAENSKPQSKTANGKRQCRKCQQMRDRASKSRRYHSMDPDTHRRISIGYVRDGLKKRAKRLEGRKPRPPIDLAFIDKVVREEINGTL